MGQIYVKAYYRSSQSIDDAVGVILDAIDKNGIVDDTIVIYSSDQGYSLGEHGNTEKHYAYEEVMRIPMIVRYPKMIKAGLRNKEMVLNIDIAPTVLDLAGVKMPKDVAGRSIVPLFKGENKTKNWRSEFLFKQESEGSAIPGQIAVRTAEYKLITYQSFPDKELYDLTKDSHEVHNVANDTLYSAVLKDMETRLENLKKKTNLKPYVHYPVENIFVFVNRDKWPLEKAENYILENSKDSKCFSGIKNKDSRWTSVKLQKSGQFVLDKDGLSDESIFIAFDIEALTKKTPFTKVSIHRRIILSEQGFHTPSTPEGQQIQAACYAYAYYKVKHMNLIDSFMYFTQVSSDNTMSGGLRLGLRDWDPNGSDEFNKCEKKSIWNVFKDADTDHWEKSFEFAKPIIGIKNWDEVLPKKML